MTQINGFVSAARLTDHFERHGADLGAIDEADYLRKAKIFLERDISGTEVEECFRTQGDLVRYNPVTEEFGVADVAGVIRTYYKPVPQHLAPPGTDPAKTHTFPTNLDYFLDACSR